jgi:5-methylthioadenosine/S-adenosylhomocysteine deaminase
VVTHDRFSAEHLLVSTDVGEAHSPGVVDVVDGAVAWSGPARDAPEAEGVTEHHVPGLLMPGLVNVHCHTPMVLMRGAGEGLAVGQWLTDVIWPREMRLEPEDVYWGMSLGAAELLAGGVTTTSEMYFHADELARAAADASLRCIVSGPVIEDSRFPVPGRWRQQLEDTHRLRDAWSDSELVDIGIGPHAAYSTSRECLSAIARAAVAEDMLVHIHVAEQENEGEAIRAEHGASVPEYLEALGLLEARVVAAHGVWLSESDIELLARRSVGMAHCPCSNGRHASGIAPVAALRTAGVDVGIATDGPVSHARLDMFEEMRTAMRLGRLRAGRADAFTARDALRMATEEAAAALGRRDLGHLRPGAMADMVALDMTGSAFIPVLGDHDWLTHAVWSGSPGAVRRVWVAGREVVDAGSVSTVDVDAAISEVVERAHRLAGP